MKVRVSYCLVCFFLRCTFRVMFTCMRDRHYRFFLYFFFIRHRVTLASDATRRIRASAAVKTKKILASHYIYNCRHTLSIRESKVVGDFFPPYLLVI